jgi:alpha-galactosidase
MNAISCLSMLSACGLIPAAASETFALHALDLKFMKQDYGKAQPGKAITGKPLTLGGKTYADGVGSHANSTCWFSLGGGGERFLATVGVDDNANGPGSVVFRIVGDDRELWQSGVMKPGDAPKNVEVDLTGVRHLLLETTDAGDNISFDHADWVDARFIMATGQPQPIPAPGDEMVVLTPKPGPQPRVNGPTIYGASPGKPFLYRIPCQGQRPLRFRADGLPAPLRLDPETGIITGTTPPAGTYPITLRAANAHGESVRLFRLVAGDTLALTPPMGWNHWYVHYDRITDKLMREAAEVMLASGMADVGYQYVNIDDCWMNAPKHKDPLRVGPLRDANGVILPNQHFPDMKGLADFIHAKGLKAGLYTSPGPLTCGGFAGSFGHEEQDARTFAEWGFDFVKYDWCSYSRIAKAGSPDHPGIPHWGDQAPTLEAYQYPYRLMGKLLKQQPRDMVHNLCQYGMGDVWEWGAAVGGHCWRTSGDLGFELNRITDVALNNARYRAWNQPGAWNDPDYIQIGYIGSAHTQGEPEPCPLTPNEQYTYMSLWSLSAAPLIFSGDMGKLDEFTINVLCNPEVIDVNQDALGQCGAVVTLTPKTYLMVKDLENGDKAVGLFNRGDKPAAVTAPWAVLGLQSPAKVRDLWRQRDLGTATASHTATVPPRGVVMLRLAKDR